MLIIPSFSWAQGPPIKKPGWSMRLQAGGGFFASTDQLNTLADGVIHDPGSNADRHNRILPMGLVDVRYTFADSVNEIHLGTPLGESGPPGLEAGINHSLSGGSSVDLSLFGMPFQNVWKDPYLVGVDREETDKYSYGVEVAWEHILGSSFEISYALAREDVDEDELGDRVPGLERDGWVHEAGLAYRVPGGRGLYLVPSLELSVGDLDGGANSYTGYRFRLGLKKFSRFYIVNLGLSGGLNNYDDMHPLFGKRRKDVKYSASTLLIRNGIFGREQLSCSLLAVYTRRDSNIAFLDAENLITSLMFGYSF